MAIKSKFVYDAEDTIIIETPHEDDQPPAKPRSLASAKAISHRQTALDAPHMHPLNRYVAALRADGRGTVPDFDPMDGGVDARVLFLLEKPGPRADRAAGSGFVSRDNDDQTAAAIFDFSNEAGIPRHDTILWNTIPWWNGTVKVTASEWKDGLARLNDLVNHLPDLSAVVMVGKRAERARRLIEIRGLMAFASPHPSPVVRATRPEMWRTIPRLWAEAYRSLP